MVGEYKSKKSSFRQSKICAVNFNITRTKFQIFLRVDVIFRLFGCDRKINWEIEYNRRIPSCSHIGINTMNHDHFVHLSSLKTKRIKKLRYVNQANNARWIKAIANDTPPSNNIIQGFSRSGFSRLCIFLYLLVLPTLVLPRRGFTKLIKWIELDVIIKSKLNYSNRLITWWPKTSRILFFTKLWN